MKFAKKAIKGGSKTIKAMKSMKARPSKAMKAMRDMKAMKKQVQPIKNSSVKLPSTKIDSSL